MHVAVDAHNLLADRRGIGVYLRALVPRLLRHRSVELTLLVRAAFPRLQRAKLSRELGTIDFHFASHVPRDADVVWSPWNGTFFHRSGTPNVVTMHDVAPFAFPARNERVRASQQAPFHRSARTATRIIADSAFTKGEIATYLDYDVSRIVVVPLAADAVFTHGNDNVVAGPPYVLFVGTTEPRKNFALLHAAWRGAFPRGEAELLVVSSDAVPADVRNERNVSRERLRDLYRGALCVAVPSLYEGFGLPALEAVACGAPVVASRTGALPEVCGDAALYADPNDAVQWCNALQRLHRSPEIRAQLRAAGTRRATLFSWERTARETLAVLSAP